MKKNSWTVNNIPDLTETTAIVTGGNSGIGLETVKALAAKNALVILACRNEEKGQASKSELLKETSSLNIDVLEVDLASFKSIHSFAEKVLGNYDKIDLLINNAGVMIPPFSKTEEGFELQFGTNHLGHFLLTGLLLPKIISTPLSRIVTVSSFAHKRGRIYFDDFKMESKYKAMKSYAQSKIANLYFTYELDRRIKANHLSIKSVAAHPGWTNTNLQQHSDIFAAMNPYFAQSPPMGALPTLYAAIAEDVNSGDFYGPDGFLEIKGYPKKVKSNSLSYDKNIAKRLWELSESLCEIKYRFVPDSTG